MVGADARGVLGTSPEWSSWFHDAKCDHGSFRLATVPLTRKMSDAHVG
jgi:hypothetical protein